MGKAMATRKWRIGLPLCAVILCCAALRLCRIGACDLWFDEAVSACGASGKFPVFQDIQPWMYGWLLSLWLRVFPATETLLRLPSAVFGTLAVIALYRLGRLLFGRQAALAASFLAAISPLYVWYSQEARAYSLSLLLLILATYYLLRAVREDRAVFWVSFAGTFLCALSSDYFCFLAFFGQAYLLRLYGDRARWEKYLVICCAMAPFLIPSAFRLLPDLARVKENFWLTAPPPEALRVTLENFNLGYNASFAAYAVSLLVTVPLLFGLRTKGPAVRVCLFSLIFPVALTWLASQWRPFYLDRYLMLFSPFYYLLLGAGLSALGKNLRFAATVTLTVLAASSLANYYAGIMPAPVSHHTGVYVKKPYRPALAYIERNRAEGDIIADTNPVAEVLYYYAGRRDGFFYFYVPYAHDRYWMTIVRRKGETGYAGWKCVDVSAGLPSMPGRLWLVTGDWARDGKMDGNSAAVKRIVEERCALVEEREFDGLFVGLYEPLTARNPRP